MKRRDFVQRAALLGGAASLGLDPSTALANGAGGAPVDASTRAPNPKTLRDAPLPISETERAQRRDKAQRLMKDLGYSAILIEPGANMTYFTGIEWARSERLFAFILPTSFPLFERVKDTAR